MGMAEIKNYRAVDFNQCRYTLQRKTQHDSTSDAVLLSVLLPSFLILSYPCLEAPKWAKPPRFILVAKPLGFSLSQGFKTYSWDTNPIILWTGDKFYGTSSLLLDCCNTVSWVPRNTMPGSASNRHWHHNKGGQSFNWSDSFFRSGLHSSTGQTKPGSSWN